MAGTLSSSSPPPSTTGIPCFASWLNPRMPQIANTPESLLPRSDSRNPATTCRGITTQGRPCRRALAASKHSASLSTHWGRGAKHEIPDPTALYCWQHKEQAAPSTPQYDDAVKPRTSIDTLMDRLGVLDIKDEQPAPQKARQGRRATQRNVDEKRRPPPKATFCCFEIVDDESDKDERPFKPTRPVPKLSQPTLVPGQRVPSRPSRKSSSPQTQSLISWIPSTLPPQTTSLLLTELAKPISSADEEGYIYMFWLTPQSATSKANTHRPLPRDIASSLVPPAGGHLRPAPQPRSISDAIRLAQDLNALTSNPTPTTPGTIRLKIGRTGNVHRRLTEWTRQCSHDLTLIRYYPYTPSIPARKGPARRDGRNTGSESHALPGRKVPHVRRVERLIHLELAGLRVRDLGRCCECGQEHREWFEVEAAKEALRRVDECVRRWVSWGESNG